MSIMHEGAFRKRLDTCPHCEYKKEHYKWLTESLVIEIALIVDLNYGPLISPEETAAVICECPKCGKKNVCHYALRDLAEKDFINKELIQKEMDERGLVNGFKPKGETDEAASVARMTQRVEETKAAVGLGMFSGGDKKKIPDYSIPCSGTVRHVGADGKYTGESEPCKEVWTKENSNPRWMSSEYLVARCSICGMQTQIQDLI